MPIATLIRENVALRMEDDEETTETETAGEVGEEETEANPAETEELGGDEELGGEIEEGAEEGPEVE